MSSSLLRTAACAVLLAAPASAQTVSIRPTQSFDSVLLDRASAACLAQLPDSAMEDVREFVALSAPRGSRWDPSAAPYWSALGRNVAELIRTSAGSGVLPAAPRTFDWRAAGRVRVTAYPDARIRWRVEDAVPTGADSLLAGALGAAVGDGLPPWPDGAADSAVALFAFEGVSMTGDVAPYEGASGIMVPVFSMRRPLLVEPVQTSRDVPAHYPERMRMLEIEATVRLEFVVDTLGRTEDGSVVDRPRTAEEAAQLGHREFVDAARNVALDQRYRPATVGGCRVPMRVRQSFRFALAHRDGAGPTAAARPDFGPPRNPFGRP